MSTIDPGFVPHLDALRRCGARGFQYMNVTDAIYGFRDRFGALDVLLVCDATDARAARYSQDDLDRQAQPLALWSATGTVADVVAELLALPPHGAPGAPCRAVVAADLWIPGRR